MSDRRMQFALTQINALIVRCKGDAKERQKLRSSARALPAKLRVQGLVQVLAAANSDKGDAVAREMANWLRDTHYPGKGSVLDEVVRASHHQRMRDTVEAEACALWLKKFAEAKIERPASDATESKKATDEVVNQSADDETDKVA